MELSSSQNLNSHIVDASTFKNMKEPLLVTSTGAVGGKIEIARQMGIYSTIGEDLVATVVDNLLTYGAQPLFMTDYLAVGKVSPEQIRETSIGIAKGCIKAGITHVTGKTEEHLGLCNANDFEISGTAVGAVDAEFQLGADRVQEGDVIIAMPASGFHTNGFALVNKLIANQELDLTRNYDFSKSLGEVLLTPSEIYTLDCLALIKAQRENIKAFAHISDGGVAENTARVIPDGLTAIYDRSTWSLPLEMKFLADIAGVPQADLERTWNVGIGMSAIVDPTVAELIIRSLAARGMKAWIAGKVEKAASLGAPRSYLVSEYR